jgi:NAD(P)-dependent dehydrogenase (short-subunit alcohol dehydrogenase family)
MSTKSQDNSQDLHGKAAIIIGGNTEIARAVALALVSRGVRICLCGSQKDLLELTAANCLAESGICFPIQSDLDTLEDAQSIVDQSLTAFKQLDILIMISPFWAGGQIHEHSIKTWDMVMEGNLRQVFLMARVVLPILRAQKHGEVMAIGSDSVLGIYPVDGAFSVAMHGLNALIELIRVENQEYGIRTHILCPGVASTSDVDSNGKPVLTASQVADWVARMDRS